MLKVDFHGFWKISVKKCAKKSVNTENRFRKINFGIRQSMNLEFNLRFETLFESTSPVESIHFRIVLLILLRTARWEGGTHKTENVQQSVSSPNGLSFYFKENTKKIWGFSAEDILDRLDVIIWIGWLLTASVADRRRTAHWRLLRLSDRRFDNLDNHDRRALIPLTLTTQKTTCHDITETIIETN